MPEEINKYTLSRQLLLEVGLDKYFNNFTEESIDSNTITSFDNNVEEICYSLKQSTSIPLGNCSIISNAFNNFNIKLRRMIKIKEKTMDEYKLALKNVDL
eukprot:CAMPEP_0116948250 /NCGR_PEP_ID=MMETSP0467-20121206/38208_1 /TAXON_ID=283647 /ORGANISM="Mesodinium pulex, Strain SPMC105" /LENGTH=99 /DNA_ID=CAMNT_0004632661 /DNA_START=578 /DNA_END=877 /DNA_ORIENTATION=+